MRWNKRAREFMLTVQVHPTEALAYLLVTNMMLPIVSHLDASGWNPLCPSVECVRDTQPPKMPAFLGSLDRMGIHRRLLRVDLLRRFDWLRRWESEQEEMQLVEAAATLHALRSAGQDLSRLGTDEYQGVLASLAAWERDCYGPANERLYAAVKSGLSGREIFRNRRLYEPALTDWVVLYAKGWTDFEGNRRALRSGLRLVVECGVLPAHSGTCSAPECTDDDVIRAFEMLTADTPERHLFYVTSEGQFRLGATEARDGLETVVGAVAPVRQQYGRRDAEGGPREVAGFEGGLGESVPAATEVTKQVEEQDLVATIRVALEYRAAREDSGSPDWIAATHFLQVADGSKTVAGLATELTVEPRTLQRAFERIREDLQSKLRGANP